MPDGAQLGFFELMMEKMHIPVQRIPRGEWHSCRADRGLRSFLGREEENPSFFGRIFEALREKTVFRFRDEFELSYAALLLPGEQTVLLIGPYAGFETDREYLLEKSQSFGLAAEQYPRFEAFFADLTVVRESRLSAAVLTSLGEMLWGDESGFEIVDLELEFGASPHESDNDRGPEGLARRMRLLEDRYAAENELMELVSRGRTTKAMMLLSGVSAFVIEQRNPDSLRNCQNYAIIFNTLLRKAAERGGVHPLHIDRLSSEMAGMIERAARWEELVELMGRMVREYCTLVKKHSTAQYSPLVQRVIARVDFDLSADLSLKANAAYLNVSAGYLSGLFKREVGRTLTDFVNGRRVEQAAYMLRSTRLSVSAIAQSCGIADDNYFSRMFKKHTGKTPKQYRDDSRAV